MANEEHLRILRQGATKWNLWRNSNTTIPDLGGANLRKADLSDVGLCGVNLSGAHLCGADLGNADLRSADLTGADLRGVDLEGADLSDADLTGANCFGADLLGTDLRWADLTEVDLSFANLFGACLFGADLSGSNLCRVNLSSANLRGAKLSEANLSEANLRGSNLCGADLSGADLSGTDLSEANLNSAILTGVKLIETTIDGVVLTNCRIYGISTWGLEGIPEDQSNLIITPGAEPVITVDNLEVAQFIYLLLCSDKIRNVVDTITSKTVLILGRFTPQRKVVLDAIREELRLRDYLPIMFDFEKPARRNTAETVSTLAHMSKFIIADITDAKSIPAELERIVPKLPSVPVQPLILSSEIEYGLFDSIECFDWVLKTYLYDNQEMLLANLKEHVIDPAEAKARELIPPAANR